ncbi:MAG: peptidylprolyl isomerase [Patescibacteria group bacterium]
MQDEKTIQENISTKENSPKRKLNPLTLIISGLILILIIFLGGIYMIAMSGVQKVSRSNFTLKTADIFNIPVAKINKNKILYTDYINNLKAMEQFYSTDDSGTTVPNAEEMSDYVLSRLIVNSIIKDMSKDMDIKISDEDVQKVVDEQILPNFENLEAAETEIMNRYGWTLKEFTKQIIIPTEMENRVAEKYMTDFDLAGTNQDVQAKAQEVLDRIKNGEDFATLAKEFGSDATAEKGGDLGWFGKGTMVEAFENAVFALEKGQLADQLVITEFGYHIVKVDDKRTVTDETTGEQKEEVKASHILFPFNATAVEAYQSYMTEKIKNSKINIVKNIHNPLEEMTQE